MSTSPAQRLRVEREFVPDCPVTDIRPHPKNARHHDRADILEGLTSSPQYKPVVVQRSTGYIIAGCGTYSVATEELGWDTIDAFFVDVDDERALVILAGDNKIGSRSGYHNDALAALLSEIAEDQGGSLAGTGFDQDELEDLLAELADAAADAVAALPGPPPVLADVPATDAAYAETPEEEAARAAKVATQVPHHAQGLTEVVLVYTEDDKAEFARLISAVREGLDEHLRAPEVVLRALRVLTTALDARHDATPVDMAALLHAADLRDVA